MEVMSKKYGEDKKGIDRKDFLKTLVLGAAALGIGKGVEGIYPVEPVIQPAVEMDSARYVSLIATPPLTDLCASTMISYHQVGGTLVPTLWFPESGFSTVDDTQEEEPT